MPAVACLRRVQTLPIDLPTAWAFFSDPKNLASITPPDLAFEVVSQPPPQIHAGLIIVYRVGVLPGFRTTWVTEITHAHAPEYFVDEQRMGPYRLWHHEHRFRAVPGGVEVEDVVHYALPFGLLGRVLAGRWVARRLTAIFEYRAEILRRRLSAA